MNDQPDNQKRDNVGDTSVPSLVPASPTQSTADLSSTTLPLGEGGFRCKAHLRGENHPLPSFSIVPIESGMNHSRVLNDKSKNKRGEINNKIITTLKVKGRTVGMMQLMAEYNYISVREMEKFFNRSKVYEKIMLLKAAGLIHEFETGYLPRKAYCLTTSGYRFLGEQDCLRVTRRFKPEEYSPITLMHTLACAQVQIALRNHREVLSYRSTKVINAGLEKLPPLQPDGDFTFYSNKEWSKKCRGAVEVELTRKGASKDGMDRNTKRFWRYAANWEIAVVLWVCGNPSVKENLQRILQDLPDVRPQKHRFMLLPGLLEKGIADTLVVDLNNEQSDPFNAQKTET